MSEPGFAHPTCGKCGAALVARTDGCFMPCHCGRECSACHARAVENARLHRLVHQIERERDEARAHYRDECARLSRRIGELIDERDEARAGLVRLRANYWKQ